MKSYGIAANSKPFRPIEPGRSNPNADTPEQGPDAQIATLYGPNVLEGDIPGSEGQPHGRSETVLPVS